jgi:3',5'-cyclic-AMP phosphodiesterase
MYCYIVHGGDTVFTGKQEFMRHFVETALRIAPKIPMFVCVGNHDELFINKSNLANFRATIGRVHWVVNIPRLHFRCIALNNVINPGMPHVKPTYGFTNSELNYLESQLKTSPRNTVLAMHVQPSVGRWSGSILEGFPINTASSKRFFHLLSQSQSRVKKVLVSHIHAYDEEFLKGNGVVFRGQGIDFVLSGGAGAPLDKKPPLIYNNFHFTEFSVTKNRITSPDLWRVFGAPSKPCI